MRAPRFASLYPYPLLSAIRIADKTANAPPEVAPVSVQQEMRRLTAPDIRARKGGDPGLRRRGALARLSRRRPCLWDEAQESLKEG